MNTKKLGGPVSPLPRLVLLALCFLAGVLLGQVLSVRVPAETGEELRRYLNGFFRLESPPEQTAAATAAVYFRYPLLAFLLGLSSVGALLLPVLTAAFGFFLSFAVCCFTGAFGHSGVLLALAVFGLRCAVTLPCYFLLAVPAWGTAASLAAVSFGGRLAAPAVCGREGWRRLGLCCLALAAGTCLDLMLAPWLVHLLSGRLLG